MQLTEPDLNVYSYSIATFSAQFEGWGAKKAGNAK